MLVLTIREVAEGFKLTWRAGRRIVKNAVARVTKS